MIDTIFQDRYRIENVLGQGGMGVVYRAHDLLLDRDVAIKVLDQSKLGTEGRVRLLREARAAAQLNHPNIVTVYDAGESGNQPFIIMELVEGVSLYEKRPVEIPEILDIARQICQALEHAHSHAIVHRDLKPENVLLGLNNQLKLMDFGMARSAASRLTAEGCIEGTVFYLAPEQALGKKIDGRVDLYALGVMLYELTVGELPFTSEDPLAIISQHLYAPVVPPRLHNDQIPPALEALILQLMSKNPEDRPVTASEALRALERMEAGEVELSVARKWSPLDRIVRGRLVGRERELAEALDVWNKTALGESKVLLISGDPGIGKTRLTLEIIALAQVCGACVLKGDCYAEGGAPYAPVAQIVEAASKLNAIGGLAGLSDLLSIAPGLRLRYPDVPSSPPLEPQAEQQRLYESLVELCAALSSQARLLVVLEDAHWADSGTLSLLRHVARRANFLNLKLLILLTYREIELDQARSLSQVLYDFNREHLAVRIKLSRLNRERTHELLAAILAEDIPSRFSNSVYRETEGNPFFTEEVCKALVEQGKLYRESGRWKWSPLQEIEIPQSIKVAIQARVARLSASALETLRTASIFGREFSFDLLKEVSDLDENSLVEALEEAERAQLINEFRENTKGLPKSAGFVFVHALIASTLSESMSGLRRQRLHQRGALAIERLYPDQLEELASQLGLHFAEAGQWGKAAIYLLQAGDRARQVYSYPEAIEYYQRALVILKEEKDYERAARTLMKLGLMYHAVFDFQRSRQAYQEGFNLWKVASQSSPTALPPATHALRVYWQDPLTLDPSMAYETTSVPIIEQLFVGLVSLTVDLDVTPELAQSWEILENGKKYIFYLREDAVWTDGTPVTAHDIVFTWKRVLDPQTCSRNHVLLYDIRGARDYHKGMFTNPDDVGVWAKDDFTLEVELEEPAGYFLHLLTYAATYPVPKHIVEAKDSAWTEVRNIVTNGPFLIEEWIIGNRIILTRNMHFYGHRDGNVDRVEVSSGPEFGKFAGRLAAYQAGLLDVCGLGGLPGEFDRARQHHGGEYVSLPIASLNFLVFNCARSPLDDARVRRAFVQSVDRETLAEVCLRGHVYPATGGMVPQGLPGHVPEAGLPFAPDQARRLMAEAGYPNGQGFPCLEVWLIKLENWDAVEFIRDQWQEHLGVESHWEMMPADVFYSRVVQETPHIFMNGWLADYPDPDNFLRVGLAFETRWNNPAYDQLIESARRITNQDERMKMYREAERILAQEAPIMPIFYGRTHLLVKPWLRGYSLSPLRFLIFKGVIIEPHEN